MKYRSLPLLFAILGLSLNSHAQWNLVTDFSGKLFSDVWFISPDTGFVSGGKYADADLCRTYDGGDTWDTIGSEFTGFIQSIYFINNQVGFITSGKDMDCWIYKTVNQGKSWYQVFEHPLLSWNLSFPTENTGYAIPTMTENALIAKTVDAGETWEIINSFWTDWGGWGVTDFQFLTEDLGYMIFESGVVYKTTDGGMNFEEVYLDFHYNLNAVFFLNQDIGYIAGELKTIPLFNDTAGVVLKTVNGGVNWEIDSLPGECLDVYFLNPDTGYIAAFDYVLETHDAGGTWQICEGDFLDPMYSIHSPDNKVGYMVGYWSQPPGYSSLYKIDLITGIIHPKENETGLHFYPNPAKDKVKINYAGHLPNNLEYFGIQPTGRKSFTYRNSTRSHRCIRSGDRHLYI